MVYNAWNQLTNRVFGAGNASNSLLSKVLLGWCYEELLVIVDKPLFDLRVSRMACA
jgi:hypothetical protein